MADLQTRTRQQRTTVPRRRHRHPPPVRGRPSHRRTVREAIRRLAVRYPTLVFVAGVLCMVAIYAVLAALGHVCVDCIHCR